ncbi:hypothetical protein BH24ACT3_BH24ACT3_01590 [soil metagenome]
MRVCLHSTTGSVGRMDDTHGEDEDPDERVASRAASPSPEEERTGSDDPDAQAEALLDESDERTLHREPSGADVEQRSSDETT